MPQMCSGWCKAGEISVQLSAQQQELFALTLGHVNVGPNAPLFDEMQSAFMQDIHFATLQGKNE